jgi:hypothetical protein
MEGETFSLCNKKMHPSLLFYSMMDKEHIHILKIGSLHATSTNPKISEDHVNMA